MNEQMPFCKQQEQCDKNKILEIFLTIMLSSLSNEYALENISLGKLHPKDKFPFEKFIDEMKLQRLPDLSPEMLAGIAITEEAAIRNLDVEVFIKEYFISRMNAFFENAPKYSCRQGGFKYDKSGLYSFKNGLTDYILSLYPLYKEILLTEEAPDPFDFPYIIPNSSNKNDFYKSLATFIIAIKLKGFRIGRCVDHYIKDLPYIPTYISPLLIVKKDHYFLANNDPESIDYKLALFSSVSYSFLTNENAHSFELKISQWRQVVSSNPARS